jgi:hypothetical protein
MRQLLLQGELPLAIIGTLAQDEGFHDASQRLLRKSRMGNQYRLVWLVGRIGRRQFRAFQAFNGQQ